MEIQAGKYYQRRNGDVVGPVKLINQKNTDLLYPFSCVGFVYPKDGTYDDSGNGPWDLVKEVFVTIPD